MRVIAAFSALVLVSGAVLAQDAPAPATKPAAAAKPAAASKPAAKPKATTGKTTDDLPASNQSIRDSYNAIPVTERMSLQSDLVWTGDYNGLINGEYSERLVAARSCKLRTPVSFVLLRFWNVLTAATRRSLYSPLIRPL